MPVVALWGDRPWVSTLRMYAIHNRENMRDHLETTIWGYAVAINLLVTGCHGQQSDGRDYGPLAELAIGALGFHSLVLTALNWLVWLGLHSFDFQQQRWKLLRCCVSGMAWGHRPWAGRAGFRLQRCRGRLEAPGQTSLRFWGAVLHLKGKVNPPPPQVKNHCGC